MVQTNGQSAADSWRTDEGDFFCFSNIKNEWVGPQGGRFYFYLASVLVKHIHDHPIVCESLSHTFWFPKMPFTKSEYLVFHLNTT